MHQAYLTFTHYNKFTINHIDIQGEIMCCQGGTSLINNSLDLEELSLVPNCLVSGSILDNAQHQFLDGSVEVVKSSP